MEEPIRGNRIRAIEQSLLSDSQNQKESSSILPFTDPPDIRNWHASYVYESPVLDSLLAFEDSNKLDDSANKSSSLATSFDYHKERPSTKVPVSLESELQLSGFADPPDIRNWHSSYVYESPELSLDLISADDLKATEQHCNNVTVGNGLDENQTQSLSKIAAFSESVSQFSELPHISNWHSSYVYESPQLSILDEISQSCYKDKKSMQDGLILEEPNRYNIGKNNACTTLPPNKDNSKLVKLQPNSRKDQKDEVFTDHDKNPLLETEHVSVPSSLLFKQPVKEQTFEALGKENEGSDIDSSGFISIKKKRANKDDYKRKSDRGLKKCSNGEDSVLSVSRGNRKALSETTNVHVCSESEVLGFTGKWKCPQRSKPSVGPPLKQLRLEKWVNLVRK